MTDRATQLPRPVDPAPPAPVADLLAELGGACCPSLAGLLERLIDRQAAAEASR